MNAKENVRLERRDISTEDLAALVAAARQGLTVRKLCGPNRIIRYTVVS